MEREGKALYSEIPKTYEQVTKTFYPMLKANDRAGLAQILREVELVGVKSRKLEKVWVPTPFPFELQAVERR
jgi:hypothetical protein